MLIPSPGKTERLAGDSSTTTEGTDPMGKNKSGGMLGVGGTRSTLSRGALRGGAAGGEGGGRPDPQAQRRELLRRLQEKQAARTGKAE
ncbi:DUF6243 family protein [Streptomyces celluloflavus]|uniref:DUF6243 family protein n=1 Tax=Streptomyces celluloflavus TaxID=58344 RepID=UPI003797977C